MAALRRRCKPICYLRLRHWCGKTLLSGHGPFANNRSHVGLQGHPLLTPAERAEREAQLRAERELEQQRLLDELTRGEAKQIGREAEKSYCHPRSPSECSQISRPVTQIVR